jgi:hypothetical protein
MNKILVLGCGDLAWGKPARPGPFEGLAAWSPTRNLFGPPPKIAVELGGRAQGVLLPTWSEFVSSQARWATRTLEGPGVLITPADWLTSSRGRPLLEAWVEEGWSWVSLEAVLKGKYLPQDRIALSSGLWLRIIEDGGGLVCANGLEAARAVELTRFALEAAILALGESRGAEWWRDEEPQTGWYVRQRICRTLVASLKQGRTRLELGAEAPLFAFSSEGSLERFRELAGARIAIDIVPATVPWWEWIAEPAFLSSADRSHAGIRWRERKTVLIADESTRQLANHLAYKGLPGEEVNPAGFEEALVLGGALPVLLPAAPLDEPLAASPAEISEEAEEETPGPPVATLPDYRPDRFTLAQRHQPEGVHVMIDGERVDQENVRRSLRDGAYTIAGRVVNHGAVVRIDYEPA